MDGCVCCGDAATKCHGNRQDQFPSGNLFVQVSEGLWDNGAACGRRYRLRCVSGSNRPCKDGTVDVRVVDFCTKRPCPSTIVMSTDAFAALSRSSNAKINIEFIQYVRILSIIYNIYLEWHYLTWGWGENFNISNLSNWKISKISIFLKYWNFRYVWYGTMMVCQSKFLVFHYISLFWYFC